MVRAPKSDKPAISPVSAPDSDSDVIVLHLPFPPNRDAGLR
jgi:hypothetical protein